VIIVEKPRAGFSQALPAIFKPGDAMIVKINGPRHAIGRAQHTVVPHGEGDKRRDRKR
jgi:hypothetical protein